jgi:hypothetical protein
MLEHLVGILIKIFIVVTLLTVFAMVVVVPNSIAQPTWELYENNNCGISLKHPYASDIILDNNKSNNSFQINSFEEQTDPDSMNMTLMVSCIGKAIPITYENMELARSSLLKDSNAVVLEDISFNRTTIDGEIAGSVATSRPIGLADINEIDKIIETNHSDHTYIIKLNFTGDEGISGFFNNYKYLEDNIIDSIKFSQ